MGTSRSSKRRPRAWTAGVLLYSGRPNPTWKVDGRRVQRLIRIWAGLDVLTRARPRAPALGYRGCFLQEDDRRDWVACAGVVTLSASGRAEVRGDEARAFE